MMKRTWYRFALGLVALLHPSASGAALSTRWSPMIKGPLGSGLVYCTTFRGLANGSVLILQVSSKTMRNGLLIVKLMNTDWLIRSGDDLPELTFRDAQGSGLTGVPEATEHGLVFHVSIEGVTAWSDTLKGEPFLLMRGGQPLAQFDSTGLPQAIRNVRACGRGI